MPHVYGFPHIASVTRRFPVSSVCVDCLTMADIIDGCSPEWLHNVDQVKTLEIKMMFRMDEEQLQSQMHWSLRPTTLAAVVADALGDDGLEPEDDVGALPLTAGARMLARAAWYALLTNCGLTDAASYVRNAADMLGGDPETILKWLAENAETD